MGECGEVVANNQEKRIGFLALCLNGFYCLGCDSRHDLIELPSLFTGADAMNIASRHHQLLPEFSTVHIHRIAGQAVIFDERVWWHIGHIIAEIIIKPSSQRPPLDRL